MVDDHLQSITTILDQPNQSILQNSGIVYVGQMGDDARTNFISACEHSGCMKIAGHSNYTLDEEMPRFKPKMKSQNNILPAEKLVDILISTFSSKWIARKITCVYLVGRYSGGLSFDANPDFIQGRPFDDCFAEAWGRAFPDFPTIRVISFTRPVSVSRRSGEKELKVLKLEVVEHGYPNPIEGEFEGDTSRFVKDRKSWRIREEL